MDICLGLGKTRNTFEQMLRVSGPKYLSDLLQQLLPPSTCADWHWSLRRLLRSMQAEHQIRLCS